MIVESVIALLMIVNNEIKTPYPVHYVRMSQRKEDS